MWPRPVAARLPYRVTSNEAASGLRARNCSAALRGPMVWLLDGPVPMRYNSLIDFILKNRCKFSAKIRNNRIYVQKSRRVYFKSTTVMPAPPNCTCSSWKWATPGTVAKYCRMRVRRIPVPVPCRMRTRLTPTKIASSMK